FSRDWSSDVCSSDLALLYLDPATVETGGAIPRERLLDRLGGLIGDRELARALEPRRRKFDDERVVHEIIRRHIAGALRRLARLEIGRASCRERGQTG